MLEQEWQNILQGQELRQSLSRIREDIKDIRYLHKLRFKVKGNEDVLIKLLTSEDAKTRKNVALLMGDLEEQKFLEPIWNAYKNESQRFVKSAYLVAVGKLEYDDYLDDIKEQLESLKTIELTAENEKHITEEMRELTTLIINVDGVPKREFIGWENPYDILLVTNRNFTEVAGQELQSLEPNAKIKTVNVGVRAKVENLKWLKEIRIYNELLFIVPGMSACPMDVTAVSQTIASSGLLEFLENSHNGDAPYYFRLEMKNKWQLKEKSIFLKKLATSIEKSSKRKLINSTDNYEFEIRMIEDKQGNCNFMIKLFTIKDIRFTYREGVIPTSIRPVNAALTVTLAKEFMKEDAQVLDPFCGVGTMLIERHKAVRAKTTYGIDIQDDAIRKARQNTEIANQIIHYINRDFFQFKHDYLFDEVITDMPFEIGRITEEEICDLYKKFFNKLPEHLNEGALVVMYSRNKNLVKEMTARKDFQILKEYEISMKEGTYVFIIRYQ